MLRKSTSIYNERWIGQTKSDYDTVAQPETIVVHNMYWQAIVKAVETSDFDELLGFARSGPLPIQ